jgi:soluble lytic murein transglycosylase-like protein
VSRHIVAQAARHDVSPALVAAIVSVENPALRPTATSSAGARGLMQVMPFWTQTAYGARCGRNLRDDVTNLCLGIHVLQHQLTARRTLRGALLAYNGCPSSTAPCGRYARIVLARYQTLTARIERDVLDLTVHGTWGAPWTVRPLLPPHL